MISQLMGGACAGLLAGCLAIMVVEIVAFASDRSIPPALILPILGGSVFLGFITGLLSWWHNPKRWRS